MGGKHDTLLTTLKYNFQALSMDKIPPIHDGAVFETAVIWRFPKMGLAPNHPYFCWIFYYNKSSIYRMMFPFLDDLEVSINGDTPIYGC